MVTEDFDGKEDKAEVPFMNYVSIRVYKHIAAHIYLRGILNRHFIPRLNVELFSGRKAAGLRCILLKIIKV